MESQSIFIYVASLFVLTSCYGIRLQGITKSISRYPTARRRFDDLVKSLSEDLEKKFGSNRSANGSQESQRVRSGIFRIFSQKSFGSDTSTKGHHQEIQEVNNGF